ncbi:ABC-2 type transport system ATP-binding protein [Pilibacter termitis]|jgi:ABC-2 type transport system ATP-binding protein|uniref:ABC-2 type transport system ATP-binding protein n=1 Tax=Pilibacter termitis TaxID=263852 RepID=A0A1T4LN14_9ENTE|nr:ABC transporter ATP-binding protein [Pilibacter termitis]SJZ56130.1 ABC-2 type transport system ATP-binding protein [Pilibacter termitis]
MAKLSINNLSFFYKEKEILKNASLTLDEGTITGLIAPNGTGKTTFIKLIINLLTSKQGEILIDGRKYKENREKYLKSIFFLPSSENLYIHLTVMEHLQYVKKIWGSSADLSGIIRELRMGDYQNKKIKTLSLGMKQHLLIALYAASGASVLLLDEPMNSLDPTSVKLVSNFLKRLKNEGKTILFSSHNLVNLAEVCDKAIYIKEKQFSVFHSQEIDLQETYNDFYEEEIE